MFNPTARYTTRGIADELPEEIAAQMWYSIDTQLMLGRTLDYLQIFKMEKLREDVLAIHHEQEVSEQTEHLYGLYMEYQLA